MCAIRFPSLAFLAEAELSIRLDSERAGHRRGGGRQTRIPIAVCGASGVGEDGCRIAPVEHGIKDETNDGRAGSCGVSSVTAGAWPSAIHIAHAQFPVGKKYEQ